MSDEVLPYFLFGCWVPALFIYLLRGFSSRPQAGKIESGLDRRLAVVIFLIPFTLAMIMLTAFFKEMGMGHANAMTVSNAIIAFGTALFLHYRK